MAKKKEVKKFESELMSMLAKESTLPGTDIMSNSIIVNEGFEVQTAVPMLNVALSGSLTGGLTGGVHVVAGPSKHFKSMFVLLMAAAYLKAFDDAVMVFYDNEFGTPLSYFESVGIDTSRVIHCPVTNIENLKFDIVKKLEALKRGQHVVFVLDSAGNIASKKEVEDAIEQKSKADMTRAKALKGLFRIITPHFSILDLPFLVVNHTYTEQGCLTANTKIQMADSTTKKIAEIEVGDVVKTLVGPQIVNQVWEVEKDDHPSMLRLEFEDGTWVDCTKNHKFLQDGCWVPAESLVVGDDLTGEFAN